MSNRDFVEALRSAHLAPSGSPEIIWTGVRRHRTALLRSDDGRFWFVKIHGLSPDSGGALSVQAEVRFHQVYAPHRFPRSLQLVPSLAQVVGDDTLIFVGYPRHRSLHDILLERAPDIEVISRLGQFLAHLHGQPAASEYRKASCPVVTHGHVTPERLVNSPPSYARLLRLIQRAPHFNRQLRRLRNSWELNGVMHGDLKADNVLLDVEAPSEASHPLIVDWEMVAHGDTRWDCGSFIGSIYMTWLLRRYSHPDDIATDTTEDLAQAYVDAFLQSYRDHSIRPVDVDRILGWAGHWLTRQVLGSLRHHTGLSRFELAAMHLAEQLVREADVGD